MLLCHHNSKEELSSLIKLSDNQCNKSRFSFSSTNSSSSISNYSSQSSSSTCAVFGNFKRQFFLRRVRISESPNLPAKSLPPKQRSHSSGSLFINFARNNWDKLTRYVCLADLFLFIYVIFTSFVVSCHPKRLLNCGCRIWRYFFSRRVLARIEVTRTGCHHYHVKTN